MSEMIERVTQAIKAEYLAIATDAMRGGSVGFSRTDEDCARLARAAVRAMQSPTGRMALAGVAAVNEVGQIDLGTIDEPDAGACYRAMIEEALK